MLTFHEWLKTKKKSLLEYSISLDGQPINISELHITAPKNTNILDYAKTKYITSRYPASNQVQKFVNTLRHELTNYDQILREIDNKLPEGGKNSCSRVCAMYNLNEMCLHLVEDMCHQFESILEEKGQYSIILPKLQSPPSFHSIELETSEIIAEAKRQKCLKENVLSIRWTEYNCKEKLKNMYLCPTSRKTPNSHNCDEIEEEDEDNLSQYAKGYRR
jgi:hypothetical protein